MKEIDNINDFEKWINNKTDISAFQEIDISKFENEIMQNNFKGCIFLGCKMTNEVAGHITKTGGIVIPNSDEVIFKTHKAKLYSPIELFKGFELNNNYKESFDYKVYEEYVSQGMESPKSILVSLIRRLHDHSITDALEEIIEGRKVVAIMGGHSMERNDEFYYKVAKISRELCRRGFLMVSGGGPGAMEATHLGAYFSQKSEDELSEAIEILKIRPENVIPEKEYLDEDWLLRAWNVIKKFPLTDSEKEKSTSVGIPTWFYGHEPPNPFATHIAKYFANSVREDGLLTIAKHGVVFSPGSAGTIQEIFQDAAQNHYAPYNKTPNHKFVSPMILFGTETWTKQKPVWNLIKTVSKGLPYEKLLHITDNENEIIEIITSYNPEEYKFPV